MLEVESENGLMKNTLYVVAAHYVNTSDAFFCFLQSRLRPQSRLSYFNSVHHQQAGAIAVAVLTLLTKALLHHPLITVSSFSLSCIPFLATSCIAVNIGT